MAKMTLEQLKKLREDAFTLDDFREQLGRLDLRSEPMGDWTLRSPAPPCSRSRRSAPRPAAWP